MEQLTRMSSTQKPPINTYIDKFFNTHNRCLIEREFGIKLDFGPVLIPIISDKQNPYASNIQA